MRQIRAPWVPSLAPGTPDRRSSSSPERTFRWLGRGDAFLGSRQFPHHLILPHGHPRCVWGLMPCLFIDLRHRTLAASSGLLATPALLWRGQSLPAASAPAPGPHTSRVSVGLLQRLRSASVLSGSLRDFFSHRSGDLSVPGASAWALLELSSFSLAASWTYV
jgi:hypothetical protein